MDTLRVGQPNKIDKLEVALAPEISLGTLRVRTESCRRYRGDDHVLRVNVKLPTDSDFDDDPDDPTDYGLFVGVDSATALCVGGHGHRLKVHAPARQSPDVGRGFSMTWLAELAGESARDFASEVIFRLTRNR